MVVEIPYAHLDELNIRAKDVLTSVAHQLFPGERLRLVEDSTSCLLSPRQIALYPRSNVIVKAQMARIFDQLPVFPDNVLFLDIETHNAEKRWGMPVWDFFRLGQYAWGEGEVILTTDLAEVINQIAQAKLVIAHNGHSFDFSVLLGNDALDLTMHKILFDTWTHAEVHYPCPVEYPHAKGYTYKANTKPEQFMRWFGLDNLAYQFGIEGKLGNLHDLAVKYNPPKTPKDELDLGLIPVDDPDFRAYSHQDVIVLRELARSMFYVDPPNDYDWKAQKAAAIDAQMVRNGVRVDVGLVKSRYEADEKLKRDLLTTLVKKYNFPTEGKKPWSSKEGKQAIQNLLAEYGITPKNIDWPRTANGALSFKGEVIVSITKGTDAEALGKALAQLSGMRSLAEQTLNCMYEDGKVHPSIDGIQRSGRRSVTKPALTTWGSRSEQGQADKAFYIPNEGYAMVSADLSNADQRAVAFMSGDKEYAKKFEPDADGHELTGRLMFGDEIYDSNPKEYRTVSKVLSHAYSYGSGVRKLAATAKAHLPHKSDEEVLEMAQLFVNTMQRHYPDVIRWQDRVRQEGASGGVINDWGRWMPVQTDRAYTQAPALMGQSSTTEVLYDGLIKLYSINREALNHILFPVHDELIYEEPIGDRSFSKDIQDAVKQTINGITFELSMGEQGSNWMEATH